MKIKMTKKVENIEKSVEIKISKKEKLNLDTVVDFFKRSGFIAECEITIKKG